jgi:hypothetical protein
MSVVTAVVACIASAALAGFTLGRWWVVVIAGLVWPIFFLGLHESFWGSGVGDGWPAAAVALTATTTAGASAGVLAGRRLRGS